MRAIGSTAPSEVPRLRDNGRPFLNLLLVQWGRRGAGVQYLLRLAQEMAPRLPGRLYVSASRQSTLFEETVATGLPCVTVETYSGAASALRRSFDLPRLRRHLRVELERHRIGLTLVCMPHPWNAAVADVFRSSGRRLVTIVHDAVPHPGERYPLPAWLLAREIGLSDGIVTFSRHVAGAVRSRYGTPAARIFEAALPSLVPETIARMRMRPARPVRLLFLGRVLPYKGLDLLLDTMHRLEGRVPVRLNIVGSGIGRGLARRIAAMPDVRLDDRWISESEFPRILDRADILIAPYREASQSGVVPAALAAGVPAIVTPVGGLVEQVENGRTGLIAGAVSTDALAGAIARLAGDHELYRRCSAGALEVSSTSLSWTAHVDRIEEGVRRVAAAPRRGSDFQ